MYKHIFGPVLSSRLGSSLGVDLLGDNICSFDCLYCESGKTEIKTLRRSPLADSAVILKELREWLKRCARRPEHITLGGPGEPCLNSRMGEIISSIKDSWPEIPLAVLTNSSLLDDDQLRNELMGADVVLPSLDSMVQGEFKQINRPHPEIKLESIVQGLLDFRSMFRGKIFLEVLLLPGVNDSVENLTLLKDFQLEMRPDRVDIAIMTRPGAYMDLSRGAVPGIENWRRQFCSSPCRTIFKHGPARDFKPGLDDEIMSTVRRRPQTPQQLAAALGADLKEITDLLSRMENSGKIQALAGKQDSPKFYISRG